MCLHYLFGLHSAQGPIPVPQPPSFMGLISVPQSPIFQGAHLCASVPILQGLISVPQGPHLCLSPHYLRASLCSQPPGYTASLLSSGRCPLSLCLQPPQGPLSPSPFQVSGGSLPALPIFLVAHLFTVGCSRGAASPAGLLATNGGTRLQRCRMCCPSLVKGPCVP